MPAPKPRDFNDLPYGMWITKDGTAYLFNRSYQPIWQRAPNRKAVRCDPHWVHDIVTQFWFWDDSRQISTPKGAALMRGIVASFKE